MQASAKLNSEEYNICECESRHISFGTVARLRTGRPDNRPSISVNGKRVMSSTERPGRLWRHTVYIQYLAGAPFPSLKWPEREANYSLPSRANVNNWWTYSSSPS